MDLATEATHYASALAHELRGQLFYAGFNLQALERLTERGQMNISRWLSGERQLPLHALFDTAQITRMSPGDLCRAAQKRAQAPRPMLISEILPMSNTKTLNPQALRDRSEFLVDRVASELGHALREHGYSVRRIGIETGHDSKAPSQWLSGQRAIPLTFTYKACAVIGLSFPSLIDRASQNDRHQF